MSHVGRLLVATPLIGDPNFERTVVFLLAHDGDGAFGVICNRATDTPVADVVSAWSNVATAPGVLFIGGPVSRESVIGLAARQDAAISIPGVVVGDVATVDLHAAPPSVGAPTTGLRLFAGSASWGPGQLEDEIGEGSWWPVDGGAADVLSTDPSTLWRRVLRRQPGQVAWFANYPENPAAN